MSVARQPEIVLCADASKDPDIVQAPPYAHVAGGGPSCSGEASDGSDGTPTRATNLSVTIQADGASSITVAPGSVVPYQVVAGLSRNAGERLAFLVLDLEFHGGDLPQADTPTNLAARVIRQGERGVPFWANVPAGDGTTTNLAIVVSSAED